MLHFAKQKEVTVHQATKKCGVDHNHVTAYCIGSLEVLCLQFLKSRTYVLPNKDSDRTYMGAVMELTQVMIQKFCTVWSAL